MLWRDGFGWKGCQSVIVYSIEIEEICLCLAVPISFLSFDVVKSMWALVVLLIKIIYTPRLPVRKVGLYYQHMRNCGA